MPDDTNITGTLSRWFVRRLVRFYYPNIVITGRERLPATGPVLYVANHANSILDPVIIGIVARRPVHFLAKAPIFDIPVFGAVLKALGMLPAYRGSDDKSQVAKNTETLTIAAECLARREAVGLFPEGKSHDELKVDQVKSGAARIVMQALAKGAKGLKVVPLGLNYERKEQFRSSIWVQVGEPVDLDQWLANRFVVGQASCLSGEASQTPMPLDRQDACPTAEAPLENVWEDKRAMRELTQEIDRRLKATVIHLGDGSWEPFLRDLEILLPSAESRLAEPVSALRQRKRLADAINHFMEHDRHRALRLAVAIQRHREELASAGLEIRSPAVRFRSVPLLCHLLGRTLKLCFGVVPMLLGALHNLLPFALVRGLGPRFEAKGRSTKALVRLLFSLPVYALWYAAAWWALAKYFRPEVATVWCVLMLPAGVFALSYGRHLREVAVDWWHELRGLAMRQRIVAWRDQQEELGRTLADLERAYTLQLAEAAVLPSGRGWKRLVALAASAVLAVALGVGIAAWFRVQSRPAVLPELAAGGPQLGKLSPESLGKLLDDDEAILIAVIANVRKLEQEALAVKADFDSGKRSFYRQEDDDLIRRLLFHYLSARTELLRLLWQYQGYNEIADERLRGRTFLVAITSGALLYETSGQFVKLFEGSPDAIRKLNEPEPRWGIPQNLYDTVRHNLSQSGNRQLLDAAWAQYTSGMAAFQRLGLAEQDPQLEFHLVLRQAMESIPRLMIALASDTREVLRESGRLGKQGIYWGQSVVSTWVGDTRVRQPREGRALIQPEQLAEMRRQLKPGDVLIERQNWFLSRAFMPGYWAHAALYVGTPEDLQRMGLKDDPNVAAHWEAFIQRDEQGHEHVILEAVPRGVRMTTLEHCIGIADSAAVLRPRVNQAQLHTAIAEAFGHLGKPYDFEFDFFSTDKLVCTELVYRCYDGAVKLDLVNVMGRLTLPPTELVRTYTAGRQQGSAPFDFVLFLDGLEAEGRAVFRDEPAFAETVDRPSLTWLQGR